MKNIDGVFNSIEEFMLDFSRLMTNLTNSFYIVFKEFMQGSGAFLILVLVATVEGRRIQQGLLTLGQEVTWATFTAVVLVLFNMYHSIVKKEGEVIEGSFVIHKKKTFTVKSWFIGVWNWFWGDSKEIEIKKSIFHSRTLEIMGWLVTFTTICFASMDLLVVVFESIRGEVWYRGLWLFISRSDILHLLEFIAGFLFSVAGVFIPQEIAKQIAMKANSNRKVTTKEKHRQIQQTLSNFAKKIEIGIENGEYYIKDGFREKIGKYTQFGRFEGAFNKVLDFHVENKNITNQQQLELLQQFKELKNA